MKTAEFRNSSGKHFKEWLAENVDAEQIVLRGKVNNDKWEQFKDLTSLVGRTIDFSHLEISYKQRDYMPISTILEDLREDIYWDKGLIPMVVALVSNKGLAERAIIHEDYILSENGKVLLYIFTKKKELDLSSLPFETIGRFACYNNKDLQSIIFPQSLRVIGDYAFADCENLQKVTFPQHMERLGRNCFQSTELTSVEVPEGIKEIPLECFEYTPVKEVKLPSTLRTLKYRAFTFYYEEGVEVHIPEGVVSIESESLLGVRKVYLPSTLRKIDDDFYYDSIVETGEEYVPFIVVHPDNPYFTSDRGQLHYVRTLIVRFKYTADPTPTCQIVSLSPPEWRQFYGLEDANKRLAWMKNHLQLGPEHRIREMWWIPLSNQDILTVNDTVLNK